MSKLTKDEIKKQIEENLKNIKFSRYFNVEKQATELHRELVTDKHLKYAEDRFLLANICKRVNFSPIDALKYLFENDLFETIATTACRQYLQEYCLDRCSENPDHYSSHMVLMKCEEEFTFLKSYAVEIMKNTNQVAAELINANALEPCIDSAVESTNTPTLG